MFFSKRFVVIALVLFSLPLAAVQTRSGKRTNESNATVVQPVKKAKKESQEQSNTKAQSTNHASANAASEQLIGGEAEESVAPMEENAEINNLGQTLLRVALKEQVQGMDVVQQPVAAQPQRIVTIVCADREVEIPYDLAILSPTIVDLIEGADENQEPYRFLYNDTTQPGTANCITVAEMQLIVELLTAIKDHAPLNNIEQLKQIIQKRALVDDYGQLEPIRACIENFLQNAAATDRQRLLTRMTSLSNHFDLPLVRGLIDWHDPMEVARQIDRMVLDAHEAGHNGQPVAPIVAPPTPVQQGNLVPDDIAVPTLWEAIYNIAHDDTGLPIENRKANIPQEYQIPDGMFQGKAYIRRRDHYTPPRVDGTTRIIWIVIHGTWGQKTKDFHKNDNSNEQNFRYIKRNASWYSTIKAKILELLSYNWSAQLDDDLRTQDGQALFNYLKYRNHFENNDEIVLLSHSHGCNLANYITQLTTPEWPIHMLIHLGCPRKAEEHYQPLHYRYLFYFFSDSDWVAAGGRANDANVQRAVKALKWTAAGAGLELGSIIIGIALPGSNFVLKGIKRGADFYRASKVSTVVKVATTVSAVATVAEGANIVNDIIQIGTHEFPTPDGKITIGFRTKMDGVNPGHSGKEIAGIQIFDGIKNIVPYLRDIIVKMHTLYPYHCSVSSPLNLNIDTTNPQDPVTLAVRATGQALQPATFEYLVNGNAVNNTMPPAQIPERAIFEERTPSYYEATRFQTQYNKSMHD